MIKYHVEGRVDMIDKIFQNKFYLNHRELMLSMLDLCTVFLSFLLAYWIKIEFRFPNLFEINMPKVFVAMMAIFIVYYVCFIALKIHKSLWKYVGPIETFRIGVSVVCATVLLFIGCMLGGMERSYLSIIATGGLLTALLMFNTRMCYRLYRRYTMKSEGKGLDKAIIIGAGDAGYILAKELTQNENYTVNVVGFVDDRRINKEVSGYRVIGDTYDIPEIVSKYNIKIAYIAMPSSSKEDIRRIYDLCQASKLETKIMKDSDTLLSNGENTKKKYPIEDISIEDLLGRGEIHLDQTEIKSYLTDRTVLVTGAGGSIGSELCRQIVKFKPKKLVMLDINENSLYMLEQEFNRNRIHGLLNESIEIVSLIASIREYTAILSIFKEMAPEVVFHAAAHKHVPLMETRPMEAIKNNVFGTNNVINACIKNKIPRFIMISTDKAVNPTNVMGATKRMTEMILQANGDNGVTKMAAVRFGNVLGSNGSVIPIFKQQIAEGGPVTITDKNIIRYFMTIPEAAQLVLQAGFYADKGEIFVLDMGQPVKILDLAEKMIRISGYKPYEDIEIKEIGLRPGEKMFEELRLDGETTTKTKNELIFRNETMRISFEAINDKLKQLDDIANRNDILNSMIKESILELIITDINESAKVS